MKKLLCLLILFFLFSCSAEKPSKAGAQKSPESKPGEVSVPVLQAPVDDIQYSLTILSANITRKSILSLNSKGFIIADAAIVWLVNGSPFPSPLGHRFNCSDARKGDAIQAKAIIKGRELLSNTVTVKNTPPEISKYKILPEVFKAGDTLSVDVSADDADEDTVSILYEWTKNGEPAGSGKTIEFQVKRGDKVSVRMTPFDGEDYGRSVTLKSEVKNLPPVIADDKKFDFDGDIFGYQIKAADPDNDPLTYDLKNSPEGMTIDKTTGTIKWVVPPDFIGKTFFTFTASDGQGGEATQTLSFEIIPPKE